MKFKALITLLTCLSLSGCWETEKGEKIGTLVKLNKQGIFIKTNEAELIRGSMNSGSGSFGKSFDFTIESDEFNKIADSALEQQKTVRIKYHKELFTLFRTETSDNSFLDSIEIIK